MTDTAVASGSPWWEDVVDVFIAPGTLFDRRAITPKIGGAFLVLIIGVTVLYYATTAAMAPIYDAEFLTGAQAAMKDNSNLTMEQLQQVRGVTQRFAGVLVALTIAIGSLLLSLVVWAVGNLFSAKLDFKKGFMIAVFAFFPRMVEFITNAIQALLMSEASLTSRYSVSLGVGRFLDPKSTAPAVLGLFGRVDLFTLWVTIVITIGLMRVGKLPRNQAIGAALVIWLVGALPAVWAAFRAASA